MKHAALMTSTLLSKVMAAPNVKLFNATAAGGLRAHLCTSPALFPCLHMLLSKCCAAEWGGTGSFLGHTGSFRSNDEGDVPHIMLMHTILSGLTILGGLVIFCLCKGFNIRETIQGVSAQSAVVRPLIAHTSVPTTCMP